MIWFSSQIGLVALGQKNRIKSCVYVWGKGGRREEKHFMKGYCWVYYLCNIYLYIYIYIYIYIYKAIGSIKWEDIKLAKQTGVLQVVFSSVF